jgi:hypothetical protein
VKEQERRRAEAELPASKDVLQSLFDWLDEKLEADSCDDTLRFTLEFAKANKVDETRLSDWTKQYGGYCDCEVLANVPDSNPVFRNKHA